MVRAGLGLRLRRVRRASVRSAKVVAGWPVAVQSHERRREAAVHGWSKWLVAQAWAWAKLVGGRVVVASSAPGGYQSCRVSCVVSWM
jgi:hypothetical protein